MATALNLVRSKTPPSQQSSPTSELNQELGNLSLLKKMGYTLLQVKVSPVSSLRGRLLSTVALPGHQRVMCILRQDEPVYDLDTAFLRAGDTLFILTNNTELTRRFFMF